MNKNIIEAKDLVFWYSDEPDSLSGKITAAVNGISVNIERGSFTAIIGHNGSGKSTLAKLISGILVPSKGSVKIFSKRKEDSCLDCSKDADNFEIRKTVGMVFQNPDNQLVSTIVEDDVAFAPENLGVEPKEIRRRVDEALEAVGLLEFAKHDTHKLSGGQKQRVAIAGILAMNPECIIFDESTAMLDPKGRMDVLDSILKLKEKGVTVVLITHYMSEAALADKVVVVHEGRAISEGSPEDIFKNRQLLLSCSLEAPQATQLLQQLESFIPQEQQCAIDTYNAVEIIEKALEKAGIHKNKQDVE